jgi:hypothetical protein
MKQTEVSFLGYMAYKYLTVLPMNEGELDVGIGSGAIVLLLEHPQLLAQPLKAHLLCALDGTRMLVDQVLRYAEAS